MPTTPDILIPRHVAKQVTTALADTPVVLVNGPRQWRKTTLVRAFLPRVDAGTSVWMMKRRWLPLGTIRWASCALSIAPFWTKFSGRPGLLRAIKLSVDHDRRPGRFLLTGSADLLTLPTVSESLAGRMEIVTLLPLSQAEIARSGGRFLEHAFRGRCTRLPQQRRVRSSCNVCCAADIRRCCVVRMLHAAAIGRATMLLRSCSETSVTSRASRGWMCCRGCCEFWLINPAC